jgi:isopenicillin-N N-acyltransferase-like protein
MEQGGEALRVRSEGPTGFTVLRATGTPYERGRAIGRALAQAIHDSLGFVDRYLAEHGIDPRSLDRALAPYVTASEAAAPHLVAQLRGMADGAEQPFPLLMAANCFEELYGQVELALGAPQPLERCTDVVLGSPGGPLLGHTEQWYAGDEGAVGIVLDLPSDGPALLAPVVAGTLPLVGINEHGVAVGAMSLSARDERVGIPRALVARDVLDARNAAEATERATRPGRAGGYAYQFAFPDEEPRIVETTATREAVIASRVHTNHALDPSVAEVAFPASPGSLGRYARAASLVETAQPTVAGVVAILADHEGEPQGICAHPDPAQGDEGSTILFAMVAEPARRTLTIAAGHACTGVFETFCLDDLR